MKRLKQKGQATIEYMLLFTVTIFIVGGLMFQFNDAFRTFVNGYFGAYLSCLLESGELPSLGYEAVDPTEESCNAEFTPFNLATGRQPLPEFSENYAVGFDGQGGTGANNNSKSEDPNTPSPATGPSSEVSASTSVPVRSGSGAPLETIGDRERRGGSNVPLSSGDKMGEGGVTGDEWEGAAAAQLQETRGGSGRKASIPLLPEEEVDLPKAKANVPANEIDIERDVRRVPADEINRKKVTITEPEELSFGDYLKYLIIFGIIVAMVIFLGGQALQISKSQGE